MPNAFGTLYTLTTFGESHGVAIGGIVDGMPPGIDIDHDFIQDELDRRKPGQNKITTGRRETDKVELLSGIFEGKSTGAPIGFMVRNENQQSKDYENISMLFRPSHADYTYYKKYGIRDYRWRAGLGTHYNRKSSGWGIGKTCASKIQYNHSGLYFPGG